MMMDAKALGEAIREVAAQQGARLTYLFGSHASGAARADSDVDVAVLLSETSADQRFEARLAFIGALTARLRTDAVDVVLLNEAPPALAFEVLKRGRLLHAVTDLERIEFQVRTVRAYEDTAPLRRLLAAALNRRLRSGRFGQPVARR